MASDNFGPAMKCCSSCCLIMIVVISAVFMAKYWQLSNTALDYDDNAVDGMTYDQCGINWSDDVDAYGRPLEPYESGWTLVFKFQAVLYTILLCMGSLALLGMCIPGISCCLMCGMLCSYCPTIAAIILTGIRLLNDNGQLCASSTAISDADTGATFKDNGETMRALWIAQCVLFIPTTCAIMFGMQVTLMGDVANLEEKYERRM